MYDALILEKMRAIKNLKCIIKAVNTPIRSEANN